MLNNAFVKEIYAICYTHSKYRMGNPITQCVQWGNSKMVCIFLLNTSQEHMFKTCCKSKLIHD